MGLGQIDFCLAFASILACPQTSAKAHKQRVSKPYKFGRLYTCRASQLAMTNKKNKQAKKKLGTPANGTATPSTTNGIDPCVYFIYSNLRQSAMLKVFVQ